MKLVLIFTGALALLVGAPDAARSQVVYLDHQHMDFRLQYNPAAEGTNRLGIILGYDAGTDHFTATNQQVYIVGNTNAKLTIPSNPNFAFLGPAGAPVWILPQSQNITLPYVGTSAEDIPPGVFDGPLNFELISMEGPGNFFAWANSGAGQPPIVKFICTNGVVSPQYNVMNPLTGSHEHYNWGFSTNGLYRVTFRCTGQRLGEATNLIGKAVAWAFQILPLRPWESWGSTNWLPATATNLAGPSADPDGDGIVNALEYALGLNPNVASTNGLPAFSFVTTNAQTFGALTFTRVKAATDLAYAPSARSELQSGAWVTLTNVLSLVDNGPTETVTVRDSAPVSATTNRFYQLRVKLNSP